MREDLADLLALVATGDQVAMAAVYDALADRVLRLARALVGDDRAAERVLVESFVRVWRQAPHHDPEVLGASAWVLAIARRCALQQSARRVDPLAP